MEIASDSGGKPAEPDRASAGVLASIDRSLGGLVEAAAALLVAAEVVILFSGVVARYGLHRPLTWSDELASTLFLWLAMLGSAIAVRHGAHMRMTALVGMMARARQPMFDVIAVAAGLGFLLLILPPAPSSNVARSGQR